MYTHQSRKLSCGCAWERGEGGGGEEGGGGGGGGQGKVVQRSGYFLLLASCSPVSKPCSSAPVLFCVASDPGAMYNNIVGFLPFVS